MNKKTILTFLLFIGINFIYASADYMKDLHSIKWINTNEKFNLVYDQKNRLVWALQSDYVDFIKNSNSKKTIMAFKTKNFKNKYFRKIYSNFDTILFSKGKIYIYYKSKDKKASKKAFFASLDSLKINGITSSWRVPTKNEADRNNLFKPYQKYFYISTDQYDIPNYILGANVEYEFKNSVTNLPILVTYRNFNLPDRISLYDYFYIYDTKKKLYTIYPERLWKESFYDLYAYIKFIVPVRKVNLKFDDLIFSSELTIEQKIKKLTNILIKDSLKVKKIEIKKPQFIPPIKFKKLKKGEFEKSVAFKKRVLEYQKEIEVKNKKINEKNKFLMQEYNKKLELANKKYEEIFKKGKSEKYLNSLTQKMATKAIKMILGDPRFKDIRYDADREVFNAVLYSSTNNFQKHINIPVPISKAKKYKNYLLNKTLIPVVTLAFKNGKLVFKSLNIISNEDKIKNEFLLVKDENSIEGYRDFINKYKDSIYVKEAKKLLQQAIEKNDFYQARTPIQIENFIKKYPHSKFLSKAKIKLKKLKKDKAKKERLYRQKQMAYNTKKHIGDKVCKDGTTSFILSITIKAFVENVNGNNIQLRIVDTEGTTVYYNGVKLYRDVLIWDRYNNWYKCK